MSAINIVNLIDLFWGFITFQKFRKFFYIKKNKRSVFPLKKVSVCIPCYEMNGAGGVFLERLLISLSTQSYKDFEVVVIDQSQDKEYLKQIIKKFEKKINIKYYPHDGRSASSGMNYAIEKASFDLIKPIFQDDFLINDDAIFNVANSQSKWGATGYFHTNYKENIYFRRKLPAYVDEFPIKNSLGCPSVMFFVRNDGIRFDENLINLMDVDFYHKLFNIYGRPEIIASFDVCIRLWAGNVSNSIVSNDINEFEKKYILCKYGYKPELFSNNLKNEFGFQKIKTSIYIDTNIMPVEKKIGCMNIYIQIEPKDNFNNYENLIKNKSKFDLILAWDQKILDECKNSLLFPFGTSWVNHFQPCKENKKFKISFLTSNKKKLPGHKLRNYIFENLKNEKLKINLDFHRSPPYLNDRLGFLESSQFSIVVENSRHTNYFTEKLIDVLLCKAIPIYNGCINIGDFFDVDGFITFSNYDDLVFKVSKFNTETYQSMLDKVEKNYLSALEYANFYKRVDKIVSQRNENSGCN